MTVIGMKEAMKDWLRELGALKRVCLAPLRDKGGFQELVAFEVNLECVFAKDAGFLSWRRVASGPMILSSSLSRAIM